MRRVFVTLVLMCSAVGVTVLDSGTSVAATDANLAYVPVTPTRIADTRPEYVSFGSPSVPKGLTTNGGTIRLRVTGRAGVPANVGGVALNLTATRSQTPGYLTVYGCDAPQPTASNLNLQSGNTVANMVLTRVDANGDVCIFTRGRTHLVVDLNGYLPRTSPLELLDPVRIVDTRPAYLNDGLTTAPKGMAYPGTILRIQVDGRYGAPTRTSGVAINLTATATQTNGFVTVYSCDQPRPDTSNLNLQPGKTVANMVLVAPTEDGSICLYSSGVTHLIVDLNGHLPPYEDNDVITPGIMSSAGFLLSQPTRIADTRPNFDADVKGTVPKRLTTVGGTLRVPVATIVDLNRQNAVLLNLTATQSRSGGYLTVYPCDTPRPTASNLNLQPGKTVANLVMTKLGAKGDACIYSQGVTHLIVDFNGYTFTGERCTVDGSAVPTALPQPQCDAVFAILKTSDASAADVAAQKRTDPCDWVWINCDRYGTAVTSIRLSGQYGPPVIVGKLPTEIGNLSDLRSLDLNGNQITSLPKSIGDLTALTYLDLSENQITAVPPELGELAKLNYLDLSGNQLIKLPNELGTLASLDLLYLSDNKLATFPGDDGTFTKLIELDLSDNQLTTIPTQLTSVYNLKLSNNRITTVPSQLSKLTALAALTLDNNQISGDVSVAFAPFATTDTLAFLDLTDNQCPTASNPVVKAWLDTKSPGWDSCRAAGAESSGRNAEATRAMIKTQ